MIFRRRPVPEVRYVRDGDSARARDIAYHDHGFAASAAAARKALAFCTAAAAALSRAGERS